MTTRPVGHVLGGDGKFYRARSLTNDDRGYIVGRVHYLAHDEGESVRGIVARLGAEGIRVSVGAVAGYLLWVCDHCSGVRNETPEHRALVAS